MPSTPPRPLAALPVLALSLLSLAFTPPFEAKAGITRVSVTITSPASGASVSGTVSVSGGATPGTLATVSSVQVAVDSGAWQLASGTTSWTYALGTTTLANGSHTISALATDSKGRTAQSSVSVTVANSAASGAWYGVLQTSGSYTNQELANQQTVGTLELAWSQYEPSNGSFDPTYISSQQQKLSSMRSAGMRVVLDAGLHYPPAWVFGLDSNTRFVDQYGDVWSATDSSGANVANAVFDSNVRNAEAAYLSRIQQDFGDSFFAIRSGGLATGELRYPGYTYNGHSNTYWAFDANAQAGSPVPGWQPGQACGSGQAGSFLSYYFNSLQGYQNWQISTYRGLWATTPIEVLYPSWGMRPGDLAAVENDCANGSSSTEINGNPELGLDWQDEVASISDAGVIVYTTWLETADQGTTLQSESPVRYLLYLAGQNANHLRTAGENSGNNSFGELETCVDRVKQLGLAGMMWAFEPQLASTAPSDSSTSFQGYGWAIANYP